MKKIFFALTIFCLFTILAIPAFAAEVETDDPVSHALNVLASKMPMAKAGLVNNELSFSADDFERAMNFSKLTSITITKAPDTSDGELKLGSVTIKDGQTISRANLDRLRFVASDFCMKETSFEFSINDNTYSTRCDLHFLTYLNHTPTLSMANELSLNVSTHSNVTYFGKLSAYDPDGDDILIEVIEYPENGVLILDDASSGEYRYIPTRGYAGNDSFKYVAKDEYGNYSASKEVSINVSKPRTAVVYRDLEGSKYANAALTMAENSIMSGTQVGNDWYFYPSETVSRAEFLVMAMNSIGVTSVPNVSKTDFYDDAIITSSMKGYVATAYELGYINGISNEKGELCFMPDREITKAEAAVMLNNMLDLNSPNIIETFADESSVPAWAIDAIYTLNSAGLIDGSSGNMISASKSLTRAEVAMMLSGAMRIKK